MTDTNFIIFQLDAGTLGRQQGNAPGIMTNRINLKACVYKPGNIKSLYKIWNRKKVLFSHYSCLKINIIINYIPI